MSVVVPTLDNAPILEETLRSLLADSSAVPREALVIDNGSADRTAALVESLAREAPFPLRLVREPRRGSSYARNAGIAAARGELLFFVDDDVLVADGWADALAAGFDDPQVGVVAGRVLPLWPSPPPAWLDGPPRLRLQLSDFGERDRRLATDELPESANLAVRRSALAGLAEPFRTDRGNFGDRRFGHEDFDLVGRLRRDHGVAYAAGAVVQHRIRPERMTLTWLRRTYFDMGAGLLRDEVEEGAVGVPGLARRLVRAARVSVHALRSGRANDRAGRTADSTWAELRGYMWAGRHVELALGRFPRLTELVRNALS